MSGHGIGLAEALLGLDGFWVLEVAEEGGEVIIRVETTAEVTGCGECGGRAESQDRVDREFRDLPCFGRPSRLVWSKRRWRCRRTGCAAKTWTETSTEVTPRTMLTRRAGWEMCPQVGANARAGGAAGSGVRGGVVDGDERGGRTQHPTR
ncbi:MAG: transposase family protein [Acidimicrobiia bacterium]